MNLTKTFLQTLQKGFDAAKLIELPKERALVYAELAKAIAMTGTIKDIEEMELKEETEEVETKTEIKKETKKKKKNSLKNESSKTSKEKTETEDETEEVNEEVNEETEVVDQWTDEMSELKAEQVERLKEFVEAWGEDYVYEECLGAWSEGAFTGVDNVRPTNIDGFVSYLEMISADAEE